EAAIPVELVRVLVRADLLAVRPVNAHDREAGDTRHHEAPLGVLALVWEPSRDRLSAGAREDRHAVVGLLTGGQGRVAEPRELGERELVVGTFVSWRHMMPGRRRSSHARRRGSRVRIEFTFHVAIFTATIVALATGGRPGPPARTPGGAHRAQESRLGGTRL